MHAFVTCPCRYEWSGDTLFILRFGEGRDLNYKGPGTVKSLQNPAPFHCRVIYLQTSHSSDLEIKPEARHKPSWAGTRRLGRALLCSKDLLPALSLLKARAGQCSMKDNTT